MNYSLNLTSISDSVHTSGISKLTGEARQESPIYNLVNNHKTLIDTGGYEWRSGTSIDTQARTNALVDVRSIWETYAKNAADSAINFYHQHSDEILGIVVTVAIQRLVELLVDTPAPRITSVQPGVARVGIATSPENNIDDLVQRMERFRISNEVQPVTTNPINYPSYPYNGPKGYTPAEQTLPNPPPTNNMRPMTKWEKVMDHDTFKSSLDPNSFTPNPNTGYRDSGGIWKPVVGSKAVTTRITTDTINAAYNVLAPRYITMLLQRGNIPVIAVPFVVFGVGALAKYAQERIVNTNQVYSNGVEWLDKLLIGMGSSVNELVQKLEQMFSKNVAEIKQIGGVPDLTQEVMPTTTTQSHTSIETVDLQPKKRKTIPSKTTIPKPSRTIPMNQLKRV